MIIPERQDIQQHRDENKATAACRGVDGASRDVLERYGMFLQDEPR